MNQKIKIATDLLSTFFYSSITIYVVCMLLHIVKYNITKTRKKYKGVGLYNSVAEKNIKRYFKHILKPFKN